MHPISLHALASERRKDLMREADRWRFAHPKGLEARRSWARWWPLRRRAGAGGRVPVLAGAQGVAPARARWGLVGARADQVIDLDRPQVGTVAVSEVAKSSASVIDVDRVTEELEQADVS